MTPSEVLKKYWGYDSFRPKQEDIVRTASEGKDVLAILPTGGGKSVCFQVPALMKEGIAIVVTPLIALMKDQVQNLNDRGIKALCVNAGMGRREVELTLNNAAYYEYFIKVNVVMVSVSPMDKHGYFNFSVNTGVAGPICEKADIVIVEVNENMPKIHGGYHECIHISDVDYIVEGIHMPFKDMLPIVPSDTDIEIASHIIPYIVDGANLQLGIGSIPNAVGKLISESDIKDLGMHTELCTDAYLELYRSGKLTNRLKNIDKGKGVFGCAVGSNELYEWLDDNHGIAAYPLEYVNRPSVIAQLDNMVSINGCVAVDLYGQVAAESSGSRQISGTGGQLDFLAGASASRGGKAFICMYSRYKEKDGTYNSRIRPQFNGDIITSPRSQVYFIATEFGVINLEGKSTWERAEDLISIAHPDFRDELVKEAQERGIWRRSNKR